MKLWQLENFTPFSAAAQFHRDESAASYWCVWIKASFDVDDTGRLALAPVQAPLDQGPVVSDIGVPLADGDLGLPRGATDIVLHGHSLPPPHWRPGRDYAVEARIAGWQKR